MKEYKLMEILHETKHRYKIFIKNYSWSFRPYILIKVYSNKEILGLYVIHFAR